MNNYTLVGVDGNAFSIMGYVKKILHKEGMDNMIPIYIAKATTGDYINLVAVSQDYVDMINEKSQPE